MFTNTEKMVNVGGFQVPENQAEIFSAMREEVAQKAIEVLETFCERVERKNLDEVLGEGIVGYNMQGEEEARVMLDPFEVPVMKIASDKGTLVDYILAANGLTHPYYEHMKMKKQR